MEHLAGYGVRRGTKIQIPRGLGRQSDQPRHRRRSGAERLKDEGEDLGDRCAIEPGAIVIQNKQANGVGRLILTIGTFRRDDALTTDFPGSRSCRKRTVPWAGGHRYSR